MYICTCTCTCICIYVWIFVHVAARHGEDGSQEYLSKWRGLPYSECTWEDGQLIGSWYQDVIDAYHERNATDTIPNKNAKVMNNSTLVS